MTVDELIWYLQMLPSETRALPVYLHSFDHKFEPTHVAANPEHIRQFGAGLMGDTLEARLIELPRRVVLA